MGNDFGSAAVLNSLGVLARNRGDLEGARAFGEEALGIHRELGDTRNVALLLNNLARVERDANRWSRAVELVTESLVLFRDLTDAWGVSTVLVNLGIMAQQTGDLVRATRLFGAAEALRETSTGSAFLSVSPSERMVYEGSVVAAHTSLGEAVFASNWRAGRSLSFEEAVAEGLAMQPSESDPIASHASEPAGPLTAREQEVAVLMATGHTNRQIAEALVISQWTVDAHVRHILTKLGLRSRAQVAAWAVEHHLALDAERSDASILLPPNRNAP